MHNTIKNLKDHFIVCGYGRMGRQIIHDLKARDVPFILIDTNTSLEEHLLGEHIPYIIGDATRDDILAAARIEQAYGLVSALSSDANNVMTVLTARELNDDLFIVSRVVRVETESKLRRAGANRVINPYQIGGHRMALTLLRPAVHDFLEHIFHFGEGGDIDIGQLTIRPDGPFGGKTIGDMGLRQLHNVNVLGIKRADGTMIIPPSPKDSINPWDVLILIGAPKSIYELERANREDDL